MQIANCKLKTEKWRAVGLRNAVHPRSSSLASRNAFTLVELPFDRLRVASKCKRAAFTLVELLITITIIAILAGLVLGVAAIAAETAREARTRQLVSRIHTLLIQHYDTYKNARVEVQPKVINRINANYRTDMGSPTTISQNVRNRNVAYAQARLCALRELMLMELPDRWSDVLLNGIDESDAGNSVALAPRYLDAAYVDPNPSFAKAPRPPHCAVYLRKLGLAVTKAEAAAANSTDTSITGADILRQNQGAECLYLIIMTATADGEAPSMFSENVIGDTDGDGLLEFLDGWGHPIHFIRWPAGFESGRQGNANAFADPDDPDWKIAAAADHDPFDMYRVDPLAFRLLPLIFSAGGDEELGINLFDDSVTWTGLPASTVGSAGYDATWWPPNSLFPPRPNPFADADPGGTTVYLGTKLEGSTDNIHSHMITDQ